ncbi:hypothetical protein BCR36DRAFT_266933, partial [Piromyces finnis]
RNQKVRFEGDIYTPKLVRFSGNAKEGLCDQCNPGRWLQLKNSAYWYHKQFFHGISSVSGKPFQAPLTTKKNIADTILSYLQQIKQNKKEINDIVNSKGMTILWYRHAHK